MAVDAETTTMSGLYPFNQLQFNLGVAPNTMAVKFGSPKPIIVEKLGPVSQAAPCKDGPVAKQKLIPVSYSVINSQAAFKTNKNNCILIN